MGQKKVPRFLDPKLGMEQDWVPDADQPEHPSHKATKADDASVPVHLWTTQFLETATRVWRKGTWTSADAPRLELAMNTLRGGLLLKWRVRIRRSFFTWLGTTRGPCGVHRTLGHKSSYTWNDSGRAAHTSCLRAWRATRGVDLEAATDAIRRACMATWWEWTGGSRPFHWQWPNFYQETIRDGLRVHFVDRAPIHMVPQPDTKDPKVKAAMMRKLQTVWEHLYLVATFMVSLTSFFGVPKGDDNIRMVYDGMKSGLNDAVWVPSFWLPTVTTLLRMVTFETWMSDLDVGEMFLNFILHTSLRPHCGIDLTHFFPEEARQSLGRLIEVWSRPGMGFKWSPYQCTQDMMVLDEVIGGDRLDPGNIFKWDRVRLNLLGSPNYDPALPWVSKVRNSDGKVVADRVIYVDDIQPTGNGKEEVWKATWRVGSMCCYHGIQDASRKRRQASQEPGAWASSVVWVKDREVRLLVSEDKWAKTKTQVAKLEAMVDSSPKHLPRDRLEEIRGFLIYIARTHRGLGPYLNGLHLTIDGWGEDRGLEGWRIKRYTHPDIVTGAAFEARKRDSTYQGPATVEAKPRLLRDTKALAALVVPQKPPMFTDRSSKTVVLLCGFIDTSGLGFGFASQVGTDGDIEYEYGQWPCTVVSEESSNCKELSNLVSSVRERGQDGALFGTEVILNTDNTTSKNGYCKGYSKSKNLDALPFELRILEMTCGFKLWVVHVSGRRMVVSGIDGISRGNKGTGAMLEQPLFTFVPLHLNALERSAPLKEWLVDMTQDLSPQLLTPEGWFPSAHTFVPSMCPPPPSRRPPMWWWNS